MVYDFIEKVRLNMNTFVKTLFSSRKFKNGTVLLFYQYFLAMQIFIDERSEAMIYSHFYSEFRKHIFATRYGFESPNEIDSLTFS